MGRTMKSKHRLLLNWCKKNNFAMPKDEKSEELMIMFKDFLLEKPYYLSEEETLFILKKIRGELDG